METGFLVLVVVIWLVVGVAAAVYSYKAYKTGNKEYNHTSKILITVDTILMVVIFLIALSM